MWAKMPELAPKLTIGEVEQNWAFEKVFGAMIEPFSGLSSLSGMIFYPHFLQFQVFLVFVTYEIRFVVILEYCNRLKYLLKVESFRGIRIQRLCQIDQGFF